MPATAGDFAGTKSAGAISRLMLVGCNIAGVIGSLVTSALIGEEDNYTTAHMGIGTIAGVGGADLCHQAPSARVRGLLSTSWSSP